MIEAIFNLTVAWVNNRGFLCPKAQIVTRTVTVVSHQQSYHGNIINLNVSSC